MTCTLLRDREALDPAASPRSLHELVPCGYVSSGDGSLHEIVGHGSEPVPEP